MKHTHLPRTLDFKEEGSQLRFLVWQEDNQVRYWTSVASDGQASAMHGTWLPSLCVFVCMCVKQYEIKVKWKVNSKACL